MVWRPGAARIAGHPSGQAARPERVALAAAVLGPMRCKDGGVKGVAELTLPHTLRAAARARPCHRPRISNPWGGPASRPPATLREPCHSIGAGLAASGAAENRSGDRACGRDAARYLYMSYRSPLKEATSAGSTRFESTVCRMTEG